MNNKRVSVFLFIDEKLTDVQRIYNIEIQIKSKITVANILCICIPVQQNINIIRKRCSSNLDKTNSRHILKLVFM